MQGRVSRPHARGVRTVSEERLHGCHVACPRCIQQRRVATLPCIQCQPNLTGSSTEAWPAGHLRQSAGLHGLPRTSNAVVGYCRRMIMKDALQLADIPLLGGCTGALQEC